ncbi:MAG: FkbM family methyltransferase [Flexilinea sp.]
MTFISYAQNYEDVILWRTLKHIERGFYIDVGAMDPTIESVTKAFYDAGWHGINIEPVQKWFAKLVVERPEDINLQIALGDKDGIVDFYEVVDTGLSTVNKDLVVNLPEKRGFKVNKNLVSMKTLNSICEEYQVKEIQFLKIDVEGAEYLVLNGLDLKKFRPWIILVEATLPDSQIKNYTEWDPLLKNSGYRFVYFDGLNRFYVAKEHSKLVDQLAIPPNVFDGFITWEKHLTLQELNNISTKLNNTLAEREKIQTALNDVQEDRERIRGALNDIKEDRYRIQIELNDVRTDQEQIMTELNEVQNDRYRIQTELNEVKTDREYIQATLDDMQSDRERIRIKLDNIWAEKEQIRVELDNVYHRKSYRITKPLRETAWFFKRMFDKFYVRKKKMKLGAFSFFSHLRMLPLFSHIADSIKKAHPGLWSKFRNNLLNQKPGKLPSDLLEENIKFLSKKERQIYNDLLEAVAQKKEE